MSSGSRLSRVLLAAGGFFVLATVAALAGVRGNPSRVELDDERDPAVAMFELRGERSGGAADRAALLVHGFQCNHSMMVPLARALADEGVHAFLLDLPGHGASGALYSDAAAADAARDAVEVVIRRTRLPRDRIILIGHSYGAMVLAPVIAAHPEHPSVFIGPGYRAGVSEDAPRDLTIVTAERDYDFVMDAASRLAGDGTGGALKVPGTWSSRSGARREWLVIPEVAHVSLIFDARTHAATVRAAQGLPRSTSRATTHSGTRRWLGLGMPLAALGLAVAFSASGRTAAIERPGVLKLSAMRLALVAAYAVILAILIARSQPPMAALSLLEGERVASFIFVSGVLATMTGRLAFGRWPLPSLTHAISALPRALFVFGLLYVSAAVAVSPAAYHVTFDPPWSRRSLAACIMAVGFYPYFAVGEVCADAVESRAMASSCRLVLPLATTASLSLLSFRLERFTFPVLALGLFCAGFGAVLSRVSRNSALGAIFASTVSAWIIAVGFISY